MKVRERKRGYNELKKKKKKKKDRGGEIENEDKNLK